MFFHHQKTLVVFIGSLLASAYAIAGVSQSEINSGPWIGRSGLRLAKRDPSHGRGFCSVRASGSAAKLKSRGQGYIVKRAFEPFPDDDAGKDTFMVNQVDAAVSVIVPPAEGDIFFNTAFYRPLGDTPVNLGVKGLTGCSSLIVMSVKAVYFTHFFEERSFPIEFGEEDEDQPVETDYDREVRDLLNDGLDDKFPEGNPGMIQEGLKGHADDFRGQAGLSAFLLVGRFNADPTSDPPTDERELYPTSSASIAEQVNELVGISPQIVQYGIDPYGNNPDATAKGRALYQYDPSQGVGRAFRLITEYTQQTSYEWAYVPGWCTMHVTHYQIPEGGSFYSIETTIFDAIGTQIGNLPKTDATEPVDVTSALPLVLVITVAQPGSSDDPDGAEIRFAYGDQSWGSDDDQCKFGGYEDGNREGDCGFTC